MRPPDFYSIEAPKFQLPQKMHTPISLGEGFEDVEMVQDHFLSPKTLKKATLKIATYFRREFGYDCIQYDINYQYLRQFAYLYFKTYPADNGRKIYYAIGASYFHWQEWENYPHCYQLEWVWFHPYWRRKGLLNASWIFFMQKHGNFFVANPRSKGMELFLKKIGYSDEASIRLKEKEKFSVCKSAS